MAKVAPRKLKTNRRTRTKDQVETVVRVMALVAAMIITLGMVLALEENMPHHAQAGYATLVASPAAGPAIHWGGR